MNSSLDKALICHDANIWEYKNILTEDNHFFLNIPDSQWGYYTNNGGGNTVTGRITYIEAKTECYNLFLNIFKESINEYIIGTGIDANINNLDTDELFIREYNQGSMLIEHQDIYGTKKIDGKFKIPVVTALLYLNSDFTGGELLFPDNNLIIKPEFGSLVIFPSKTVHGVSEILSGKRYLTSIYVYESEL